MTWIDVGHANGLFTDFDHELPYTALNGATREQGPGGTWGPEGGGGVNGNPDYPHAYIFTKIRLTITSQSVIDTTTFSVAQGTKDVPCINYQDPYHSESKDSATEMTFDLAEPFDTARLAMCVATWGDERWSDAIGFSWIWAEDYGCELTIVKVEAWAEEGRGRLYKNTGFHQTIEYPPRPEPPPPAPDPEVPSPPGDGVETEDSSHGDEPVETEDSPHGDEPVERNPSITFLSCTTDDGYPGIRLYVDSVPQGGCMRTHSEGVY